MGIEKEHGLKAERLTALKRRIRYRFSSANTCYFLGGLCSAIYFSKKVLVGQLFRRRAGYF